jgi:hypothetical protein
MAAALASKRARRAVLLAAIAPAAIDWLRKPANIDPVRYIVLRLIDDMSYGVGLTLGALRDGSIDALRPDFTSWPRTRTETKEAALTQPMQPKPPM